MEYKKLNEQISDPVNDNVKALANLFPSAVKDGEVDFEALKEELGKFSKVGKEKYELTWAGKQASKKKAQEPVLGRTLKYVPEDSKDADTTQNLYIEGDNLEVLKLLRENYYGSIKMIYIDPPYNTGNDFIYNDDFKMTQEESDKAEGDIDKEGNRLIKNEKANSRFHARWLNMIYPRLRVAKKLLTQDGVIFISIDDNEMTDLRQICDDIFEEQNFIANIVRNTNSSKNQSLFVSVSHDYCLIYAKNINFLQMKYAQNKWSVPKNNVDEYIKKVNQLRIAGLSNDEITEELKQLTKYPRFIDFTNYWYFDEKGLYRKDNLGGVKDGNKQPILNPLTNKFDPVPPGGFRYNKDKLTELINEKRIHFHTDGSLPVLKRYLNENTNQRPKSIMSDDQRPDYSLLKEFNIPFDNPKQMAFMKRIISIFENDSIFLDFFSGSSTTAHAVMQLNAEDGGHRKFIMVQLPEPCDEKSEAYKAGFKNICEIGRARIWKAGDKIKKELKEKQSGQESMLKDENNVDPDSLDIGFKVFRTGDTNIRWTHEALKNGQIDIDQDAMSGKDKLDFMPGFKDIDVVYEVLLRQRDVPLSSKIEKLNDIGDRTYMFAESFVVCLEEKVDKEMIEKLAAIEPLPIKYVFRDSAFEDDIELKDETFRRLNALIERNTGESGKAYTVEFI